MKKEIFDTVEYKEKIVDIPISQIDLNDLNPRKRFVDSEEDVLIESILSKGLLNPIIVYKRKRGNRFVILDGERRFRAFKKLNKKEISCHVLEKEPTELENLSMMFHIHNVREEWTDFAIAQTLLKVIYEMGKDIKHLERQDKLELSKITSLSEYKINKYLVFYDYPQSIIDRFMASELKEEPDKGMDPDILAEMHAPIKIIEDELSEFLTKYSKEKIIDACVKKKASDIIKTNRDFRQLTKSLTAMKRGNVRKELMFDKLESFVKDLAVTPQQIFEQTSEAIYQVDSILKKTDLLIKELQNLNLNQITREEKSRLEDNLKRLTDLLNEKLI
ncbi:MAG: ParB N-terminal domain-containing protein [Ignavibacteriaceae bacterium]|nr:ParB N-terminal domain-containing protein [Ignavibacteriaceae bacterium]